MVAGFLHFSVVLRAGTPVEGFNLYNNGFSGGLISIVLFPVVTAIFRHSNPDLVPMDFFVDTRGDKPAPLERDQIPTIREPAASEGQEEHREN